MLLSNLTDLGINIKLFSFPKLDNIWFYYINPLFLKGEGALLIRIIIMFSCTWMYTVSTVIPLKPGQTELRAITSLEMLTCEHRLSMSGLANCKINGLAG